MLSNFLLLVLASSTALALPQPITDPSPDVHKRNFTIVQQACLENCTRDCGSGGFCGMICTIKCPSNKKRANLFALEEEDGDDGFEDIPVAAM